MAINLPVKASQPKPDKAWTPDSILEAHNLGQITERQSFDLFLTYLRSRFDQDKLARMLDDICKASDLRIDKDGEFYEAPNWNARLNGLKEAIKLLYAKSVDSEKSVRYDHPTQIVFNVITKAPKTDGNHKDS